MYIENNGCTTSALSNYTPISEDLPQFFAQIPTIIARYASKFVQIPLMFENELR